MSQTDKPTTPESKNKEKISVAYLHALCAKLGFNIGIYNHDDDSVDMSLAAKGQYGKTRSPKVDLQLKCTSKPKFEDADLSYVVKKKNFDDLSCETMAPRYLVVAVIPNEIEEWLIEDADSLLLKVSSYWFCLRGMDIDSDATSKTIKIPRSQKFGVDVLARMMSQSPDLIGTQDE